MGLYLSGKALDLTAELNIIIYSRFYEFKIETIWIIIGAVIGSIIGNLVVGKINKNVLSIIFAIFTIIMGIGLIK